MGLDTSVIDHGTSGVPKYVSSLASNIVSETRCKLFLIHFERTHNPIYEKAEEILINSHKPFDRFIQLPLAAKRIGVDIIHIPTHLRETASLILPLSYKKILTIHDLLQIIPLSFPEANLKIEKDFLTHWIIKIVRRRIDRIIAVSKSTRRDLVNILKIPEEIIRVIYEGVDERYRPVERTDEALREYGLDTRFVLYVGLLSRRKNIPTLMKAFYKIKKRGVNHKLVIVGSEASTDRDESLSQVVRRLNLQDDVVFTGYVPEEDLPKFYSAADLFVYPSLYEGFGLPPLEAMACGCPVITSNTSSLPEVVGSAGITVDPYDTDALVKAMQNALTDENLRQQMRKKGLKRAEKFTWRRTAEETLKVYEEVYNGR